MTFECTICNKTLGCRFSLKRHLLNCHNQQVQFKTNPRKKCPLCDDTFEGLDSLFAHLSHKHQIQLEEDEIRFKNFDDFITWKRIEEKNRKCEFVKHSQGFKGKTLNCVTTMYYCHRSGAFKSRSKGKHNLKMNGSNKINAICPARMRVIRYPNKLAVHYIKTHVGHAMEVSRMRLTKDERKTIAKKLEQNIPVPDIIEEVKCTDSLHLERINLLSRQDVVNVAKSFNLRSANGSTNEKKSRMSLKEKQMIDFNRAHEALNASLEGIKTLEPCKQEIATKLIDELTVKLKELNTDAGVEGNETLIDLNNEENIHLLFIQSPELSDENQFIITLSDVT